MRFAYLKYRLKKMGCYLLIIILLPYIITVFLSGPGAYGASRVDETMVNVKADGEKSGSDGGKQEDSNAENVDKIQMPLSEYCIGIMAREIPAVYEEEALKTQAVLVRTQVCLALGAGADTGQRKICRIPGEQINIPSIISGLSMHGRRPTDRC